MAAGDTQLAFAVAAAEDGIVLHGGSFDWLCEQGHVGLERVAKARRDPALVAPVTEALETLAAIYARLQGDRSVLSASRENLLLPVDLVHEPTGTLIQVDESPHFTSFRLTALELYPVDAAVGFDLDEHKELCRVWSRPPTASAEGYRRRVSASAASGASAPITTRSAISPPPRWATRRSSGSRRWTATVRPRTRGTARRSCAVVLASDLRAQAPSRRSPRR